MAWIDPNPSRIPTVVELYENKLRIKKLDDRIMQLTEELERCQDERDGRRRFIAPFRRLPHELLCEIASHGLDMGQSPLTLSHVCVSSRRALSGMKSLWTRIVLRDRWSRFPRYQDKFQVSSQYYTHPALRMVRVISDVKVSSTFPSYSAGPLHYP